MSTFEYKAPQFVDFNAGMDNEDSDEADTFFDVEYEESPKISENKENVPEATTALVEKADKIQPKISPVADKDNSELHMTKKQINSPKELKPDSPKKREIKKGVRRLSADMRVIASGKDLSENTCMKLHNLSIKDKIHVINEEFPMNKLGEKLHAMTTRKDAATKSSQPDLTRVLNENVSRKRKLTSRASEIPQKFVALAEHTLHFQKDTPPRFHSSKRTSFGSQKHLLKARMSYKPQKTLPVTPKLMTASRSRPSIFLPQQEREILEMEEMKKNKVKALPLNEKILQPPKPLQKSEKQPTVQEPFNLTQVFKKPAPVKEAYVFTANPVPKGILEKSLALSPKRNRSQNVINKTTVGYKPPIRVQAFTNDNNVAVEEVYATGVPIRKLSRPRNTEVKPFSFELRELEKKEQKKQQQLEETKQTFRARSPRVLRKSPFKPTLDHSHSQPHELTLNTERRIHERRQFEIQQQLKEEKIAYEKNQIALEKARKEEEEIARLRQEAVHKARPMPLFKTPAKIVNLIPLTDPKSPKFSKRTRTSKILD